MLGIQELDDLFCLQLTRPDLARCARVNKKWHSIVIPHLWRDLTNLDRSFTRRLSFCRMVLEDYLGEQQQRQKWLDEGSVVEQDIQPQSTSALTALAKYGSWIRVLPALGNLMNSFHCQSPAARGEITAEGLVLHLFRRCPPYVQVDFFMAHVLDKEFDLGPGNPKKTIIEFTLPRVRRLCVRATSPLSSSKVLKLMDLLDQCSDALLELELDIDIPTGTRIHDVKEEQLEKRSKDWISLKKLCLYMWTDNTDTNTFWPWLFKRCGHVEKLEVHSNRGTIQVLIQAMLSQMPKLTEITLGTASPGRGSLDDNTIADLLSGSCKGWRGLNIRGTSKFGMTAMKALEKHFSTLEVLVVDRTIDVFKDGLAQVLSSCDNLHTLVYGTSYSDPKKFADQDPTTGSLKPWKCESTLKVLHVAIVGRPEMRALRGSNFNHDQETETLVYDRLARLTKLETLCLDNDTIWARTVCLGMTLDGGLHKLSGSTMLKELHVPPKRMSIGMDEVQWMTEHWPRLRGLYGLCNEKAVAWLRQNHPEIKLTLDHLWLEENSMYQ
ncbi:MAG: hypothetical protein J3Q66DRAFT_350792 [Benniella sp.]|nr:MAG: hypothetical protein J3Q66DRAFT_350792 [Benniella sp.]